MGVRPKAGVGGPASQCSVPEDHVPPFELLAKTFDVTTVAMPLVTELPDEAITTSSDAPGDEPKEKLAHEVWKALLLILLRSVSIHRSPARLCGAPGTAAMNSCGVIGVGGLSCGARASSSSSSVDDASPRSP